jgi:hypothetical protein
MADLLQEILECVHKFMLNNCLVFGNLIMQEIFIEGQQDELWGKSSLKPLR